MNNKLHREVPREACLLHSNSEVQIHTAHNLKQAMDRANTSSRIMQE